MKKLLCYVLILVLSLSMTACGNAPSEEEMLYEKYEALISAAEREDYAAVQKEVDKIFGKSIDGVNEDVVKEDIVASDSAEVEVAEVEASPAPTEDPNAVKLREIMISEWIPIVDSEVSELGRISFDAEGTCNVGGENLSWEVMSADESGGELKVFRGSEPVYEFYVYCDEKGCYYFYVYKCIGDGTETEYLYGEVYRAKDVQELVITKDNWEEYFVLKSELFINYDAFGEVADGGICTYLLLNPEKNTDVIDKLSYVAIEFERLDGFASVDVNMETEEFSYKFLDEPTKYTIIESMQEISIDEIHSYGYCVGFGNSIDLPHDDTVSWGEFSEMLRIEGVIYCVAP